MAITIVSPQTVEIKWKNCTASRHKINKQTIKLISCT